MRKRSAREKSGRGNKGWKYWGLVLAVLIAMLSAAAGGAFAEAIEEVSEAEVFTREGSIVNCRPQAGTPLHITSMVPLFQQGVGTASPENVREIVKVSSVTVTQTVDEQTVNYTVDLPDGLYGGQINWSTGEATLFYKVFDLPVAEMDNEDDAYPGWKNIEGFEECFTVKAYNGRTDFAAKGQFMMNIGTQFSVDYDAKSIMLAGDQYGKTGAEWKEQYPELVCRIAAPLLVPQTIQVDAPYIEAMDGFNVLSVDVGDLIVVGTQYAPQMEKTETAAGTEGKAPETKKSETENSAQVKAEEMFDPWEWGLPVLELMGDTSAMSKDTAVDLTYSYDGMSGACKVKLQGTSSLVYKKKNYTITFDQAFEAAEGWGSQKKYCLKANYIDHSHARNVVNAKLWGQIVKSRENVPAELADLPNGGAVDGFPVIITLDGEFHGLYTFNIPKDGWMFGMGEGAREAIVCANAYSEATAFEGAANIDENDFELEYVSDENDAEWVKESLNRLIDACRNSDGTDLDTTIAQYLDWQSAIDYYIFTVLVEGADMTLKNYLLSTFDGTKWYFSAYDMDSTHGLHWDGSAWLPADYHPSFEQYAGEHDYHGYHLVMKLIRTYKLDELKARYWELRETVLSESNVATMFGNFCGQIPSPVYLQDVKKWPMIPNTAVNNVSQIRDYYRLRAEQVDAWIEALE